MEEFSWSYDKSINEGSWEYPEGNPEPTRSRGAAPSCITTHGGGSRATSPGEGGQSIGKGLDEAIEFLEGRLQPAAQDARTDRIAVRASVSGGLPARTGEWTTRPREYAKYQNSYWPVPNRFVTGGHLARLWNEGLAGAVSIAPIVGVHMNTFGCYRNGYEEMARLAGVSARTVQSAGRALKAAGLGAHRLFQRANRTTVSEWALDPVAYVPAERDQHVRSDYNPQDRSGGYFSFPAPLIFGGNWARLSAVQRLVYLAVGARARTYSSDDAVAALLGSVIEDEQAVEAILQREGRLSMEFVSLAMLEGDTGASRSALSRAITQLPAPYAVEGGQIIQDRSVPFAALRTRDNGTTLWVMFEDFAPVCGQVPRRTIAPRRKGASTDIPSVAVVGA